MSHPDKLISVIFFGGERVPHSIVSKQGLTFFAQGN